MNRWKTITVTMVGSVVLSLYGCYIYLDTPKVERLVTNRFEQNPVVHQLLFRDHLTSGWKPPTLPDHLQNADQKDPELIQHIREHWIIPPFTGSRNLPQGKDKRVNDFSQHGVPTVIDKILNGRRGGFLVECGAADGLITSNSLWLEMNRNWTGLLIEANPSYFSKLLQLKRHMFMLNACLSPTTKPELLRYWSSGINGGISDLVIKDQFTDEAVRLNRHSHDATVQCFPFYSVLAALDVMHVDFFSLDVEGAEIPILKTVPCDDITIDSFVIEKRLGDKNSTERKTAEIINILSKSGFEAVSYNALDVILVRRDLNSTIR